MSAMYRFNLLKFHWPGQCRRLDRAAISKACGGTLTKLACQACRSQTMGSALCGMFGLRRNNQGCRVLSDLNLAGCQQIEMEFGGSGNKRFIQDIDD